MIGPMVNTAWWLALLCWTASCLSSRADQTRDELFSKLFELEARQRGCMCPQDNWKRQLDVDTSQGVVIADHTAFKGSHLKIGVVVEAPFVMRGKDRDGSITYEGIYIDFLESHR